MIINMSIIKAFSHPNIIHILSKLYLIVIFWLILAYLLNGIKSLMYPIK